MCYHCIDCSWCRYAQLPILLCYVRIDIRMLWLCNRCNIPYDSSRIWQSVVILSNHRFRSCCSCIRCIHYTLNLRFRILHIRQHSPCIRSTTSIQHRNSCSLLLVLCAKRGKHERINSWRKIEDYPLHSRYLEI